MRSTTYAALDKFSEIRQHVYLWRLPPLDIDGHDSISSLHFIETSSPLSYIPGAFPMQSSSRSPLPVRRRYFSCIRRRGARKSPDASVFSSLLPPLLVTAPVTLLFHYYVDYEAINIFRLRCRLIICWRGAAYVLARFAFTKGPITPADISVPPLAL